MKPIRIGTRGSPLALVQVKEIQSLLKDKGFSGDFDVRTFTTQGDADKKSALSNNPASNFFTDVIDAALIAGEIDISINSAKDLPQPLPSELTIVALTASADETDCLVSKHKLVDLPSGAKVGTSSVLRQTAVKAINPHVTLFPIRGTVQERIAMVDRGECDGVIVATIALKRLGLTQHIQEIMPWEAIPLQGQLAVVARRDNATMKNLLSSIDVRQRYGKVFLVGAGPGDPGLITVAGVELLRQADVVFYDYLVDDRLLNYAPQAEKIYVGKRKGCHAMSQAELSRAIRQHAILGKNVIRLKGGDPLIFGRGADEIAYLRSYFIDVHVIPGVSSATAIPSSLGIPLTARGISSSVAFVSGHGENEKDQPQVITIPNAETIVFLMGLTKIKEIVATFIKDGWPSTTPVAVISKGTRLDEKIVLGDLSTIVDKVSNAKVEPPALIIVGKTIDLYNPLISRKILYTGTNPEKYKIFGHIIHHPMITIVPHTFNESELKGMRSQIIDADVIAFTSRFGVQYFFDVLKQCDLQKQFLNTKVLSVVGVDTAQTLRMFGFEPSLIASEETGDGLFKALERQNLVKGKKVLLPRSSLPNPLLKDKLHTGGASVVEITVYENVKPTLRPLPLDAQHIDEVIFTSPSTVRNFYEDYGTIPQHWLIWAKGKVTADFLKSKGFDVQVI